MSRQIHSMPEALSSKPSQGAWGCASTPGWVPYPKKIPRRHALIDSVGRIDDPCDRPVYQAPEWKPKPAFAAPKEGYPNDVCDLSDYSEIREQGLLPEGSALINLGKDTPKGINLRIPAVYMDQTSSEGPSIDECCNQNRTLDPTRQKYQELIAEMPKDFQECPTTCTPSNPDYPCHGVIGELMRDPGYINVSGKDKCLALGHRSDESPPNWRKLKPLTGWEYVNGKRTCDLHPVPTPNSSSNSVWFTGYGCEKPSHPFYVTTTADYGRFSPNPRTMTQRFNPRSSAFTKVLQAAGMYRNRTLNTSNSKSVV